MSCKCAVAVLKAQGPAGKEFVHVHVIACANVLCDVALSLQVLRYLQLFADRHGLNRHIAYNTQVLAAEPLNISSNSEAAACDSSSSGSNPQWQVSSVQLDDRGQPAGQPQQQVCGILITVCMHYAAIMIPASVKQHHITASDLDRQCCSRVASCGVWPLLVLGKMHPQSPRHCGRVCCCFCDVTLTGL